MKGLHMVTLLLLIIGGINWLLVGVIGWDIGDLFGGQGAIISRVIYVLIGISAIVEVVTHKKGCKECDKGKGGEEKPAAPPATPAA